MRVRFAPSPTGSLHIGSARTALFNWLFARHNGGRFVLRVEDTDARRSDRRHEEAILDDLRWLGLDWDEGPDVGGPYAPYRQSERLAAHQVEARALLERGDAYHCFCSEERLVELRARQVAEGRTPRYDRRCLALSRDEVDRRLADGEPAVLRLKVREGEVVVNDLIRGPVAFSTGAIGDFIILRSDGTAGYNFTVVVDDRDMCITQVIRGDDHLTNTVRQLLLFEALGSRPPDYAHHSMIHGEGGGKLSKRHGATAVGEYRDRGYLPEAVVNYLALLSWSHGEDEVLDRDRLVAEFELEKLGTSPAIFDQAKLDWLDHEHILTLDPVEHERRFAAWLSPETPPQAAAALAAAFQPSLVAYGQAPALAAAVLEPPALPSELRPLVDAAGGQLAELRRRRAAAAEWLTPPDARELLAGYRAWGKERGLAPKDLLMPLRVALTGAEHGPELHYVLAALDRAETLARLGAVSPGPGSTRPAPDRSDEASPPDLPPQTEGETT